MIRLINGRGQLGSELSKQIESNNIRGDAVIYHTWIVDEKSEKTQRECYKKFTSFVDENKTCRLIFISTYSEQENYYNHFKQLSEAYLLDNNPEAYVIRLPTLIGKGVCERFRENTSDAFGNMELMAIEDAAEKILSFVDYSGLIRNFRFQGEHIPAKLAKKLIQFGKHGR